MICVINISLDFVVDKEDVVFFVEFLDVSEVVFIWDYDISFVLNGFDDEGGCVVVVSFENGLEVFDVVVVDGFVGDGV